MAFKKAEINIVMHKALEMKKDFGFGDGEAMKILEKSHEGGEFNDILEINDWYENRFSRSIVLIDEDEYARMCIDALKTAQTTAATDFGSSRQRDLGQLWSDMIRGYLGEAAFKKFLFDKYNIQSKLAHEKGELEDFLDTDIPEIKFKDEGWRAPDKNIGIKTTKTNGVWLDIPGDQFNHSDYHVLVKVGVGRDHLFGFFKKISVFKDKILQLGMDIGALNEDESNIIFDSLPTFSPIKAYICGFVKKNDNYEEMPYDGKKGRIHYTVTSWNGAYHPDDFSKIKVLEELSEKGKVRLLGIGELTNQPRYLFNTGSLRWSAEDWNELVSSL